MNEPNSSLLISEEMQGERLDKLLSSHFPTYSRTYFQGLIEKGAVLINGQVCKKREKPKIHDEVDVCFLLTEALSLEPEAIALDILYEDEHLLAINKPPGMVVHPAPGHPTGTFVHALLHHCHIAIAHHSLRPGIVHRLDKDTSGVLLAAKTVETHQKLVALFADRHIEKHYWAVTVGKPPEGLIDAPIGRHPVRRKEMAICKEKGKEAKTLCKKIAEHPCLTLVELTLLTGRTHQLRVHLQHIGTPILGDPVYGSIRSNHSYKQSRQLLHARSIRFSHPVTGQPIFLQAPLPQDLADFLQKTFPHSIPLCI